MPEVAGVVQRAERQVCIAGEVGLSLGRANAVDPRTFRTRCASVEHWWLDRRELSSLEEPPGAGQEDAPDDNQ